MAKQTPAMQIYNLLVTKDFDPQILDNSGRPAQNPAEAEIFSFDYTAESGNDYGTVVVMLGEDNDLQLFFGDNLGKGMEPEDKDGWFNFLSQMKEFATKNLMSFSPKDLNKLKYSMAGQAALKEGLFESWTGTRTTSWNGKPTEARLMIRHKRPLGETDARFRYVESLFIETAEGERYKLPFTKLAGGRAMVEHVRNGGKPYDTRGQHIAEMVQELNVLSRFRRANHGKIFEGDTAQLVTETNAYYESLNRQLKSLSTNRGYKTYFESWNPLEITEQEVVIEGLKHLFVTQTIDNRIEDALPLLAKIQQQGQAMKEANIFEAWANQLMEGTWAIPDTKEKQAQLVELMSKEFPVGADATNATEQLYELFGDDELFDQLEALAEKDANADCRQVVYDRMQMLSDNPNVKAVIDAIQIDPQARMNPAPQVNPDTINEEPAALEEGGMSEADLLIKEILDGTVDLYHIYANPKGPVEQYVSDMIRDRVEELAHERPDLYQDDDIDRILQIVYDDLDDEYGVKEALDYKIEEPRADHDVEGGMSNILVKGTEDNQLEEGTALQGQYGHQGKLQAVAGNSGDADMMDRIKFLAGVTK